LVAKRPWFPHSWGPSEQPNRLEADRRILRFISLPEYVASAAALLTFVPLLATRLFTPLPVRQPRPQPADFIGVAITPDHRRTSELVDLVAELGTRRLLMRVPVWQRGEFDAFRRFADRLGGSDLVISVVQDRGSVCDLRRWREDLRSVFSTFAGRATHFQLPTAPNRSKWGCVHMGDALDLLEAAQEVRRDFPWVRLVGPGIIDFEPVTYLRGLANLRRFSLDVVGAMLYVDRRGSPRNTQLGIFDLATKLRLWKSIAAITPRCRQRGRTPLWITEFNWPLIGTGTWSPTGNAEQVSEADAAEHLLDYCRIAFRTGVVERLYWWQLVHPGFGLVDNTHDSAWRRRPTFDVARRLISGELPLDGVPERAAARAV
jgi:hypothetical protein